MTWTGYYPPAGTHVPEAATVKVYPDTLIGTTGVAPLLNLLFELPHGAAIAVDTETTGLFPYEDDVIRGVSIAFLHNEQHHSFYIPVGYPNAYDNLATASMKQVFRAIKALEPFYIFHHGKFDFAFLRQLPMDTDGSIFFPFPRASEWWDTKVVAWLLDENMPTGLKEQAAFHFGEDSKDEQKAIKKLVREKGWEGLTPADTAQYAAKDAELTYRLYERQLDLIDHPSTLGNIRPAIERELAIQAVLSRMEATGILINPELLASMTETTAKRIAEIESMFSINLKSPAQVGAMLYDMGALPDNHPMTASGKPSMNRAALESLDANSHPALALLLEHRRLQKAASGYLHPLKDRIGSDGRVHAGFSSTGTVTGRFSCSNPNLQTIPRADTLVGVRDIFIPEPGFDLYEYDLQAAELRVMAGLSGEQRLIDQLETPGCDMHSENAAAIFGEGFTGLQRRSAKNIMYGAAYGLTSISTAVKYIPGKGGAATAKKILDSLRELYPGIFRFMGRKTREADKAGFVPIGEQWPGRYRRFRTPSPRLPRTFTASNALIQGAVGEAMKSYMLLAEPLLDAAGARLVLQVHDAFVIEVPEGHGDKVRAILQQVADDCDFFDMKMVFEASPWAAHE